MSTSLLYHGFGLVGYDYVHSRYQEGAIIFSVKRKRGKIPVFGLSMSGRHPSGHTFQAVPDGSDRIEKSVPGL